MNSIKAIVGRTEFVPEPHLIFSIDGVPLHQLLSNAYSDQNLQHLIPTTLGWMVDDCEEAEVWKRFTDFTSRRIVIPILCCPDDLDFTCSLVVVEVTFEADLVNWLKFGLDVTPFQRLPGEVGSSVNWLSGVGPFTFARDCYIAMVHTFNEFRQITN